MRVYSPSKNYSISFLFAQLTIFCLIILMASLKSSAVVGLASKPVAAAVKKISSSSTTNVYYWFRLGDLRLHDNPGFNRAVADYCGTTTPHKNLIPVFCFDPRIFGGGGKNDDDDTAPRTELSGLIKTCPKRAQFVIESVTDLRQSLQQQGSTLLVPTNSKQTPEQFFQELLVGEGNKHGNTINKLIYQEEVCSEEQSVATKVAKLFSSSEAVWGSTMYELDDLPYDLPELDNLPNTFTPFRNQVEKKCQIRTPLPIPTRGMKDSFTTATNTAVEQHVRNAIPTLEQLGYTPEQITEAQTHNPKGVMTFQGGETAALQRVQDFIWNKDLLKNYFNTRNGMLGADYSTKFSPWLAHGNLSPRYIAMECKKYEQERVENKSTYWVVFELLWRDYFKFFAKKHGATLFAAGGTMESNKEWKHYKKNVQAWIAGKTGYPLVDANMRELAATGFMSNRGRQNVASFLTLELNEDWRYGAEYFESVLLDHDVHSNYGNWCAAAGMTGGRVNRFNIVKQGKDYDQHGEYVRHWLPELQNVPTQFVHEPWKMNQFQQMEANFQLGVDYPNPIIKPFVPNFKQGSRSKGDGSHHNKNKHNKDRRSNNNKNNNSNNKNRGRGQRKDMKSLKTGRIDMST